MVTCSPSDAAVEASEASLPPSLGSEQATRTKAVAAAEATARDERKRERDMHAPVWNLVLTKNRSEERRVGKEGRTRVGPWEEKEKTVGLERRREGKEE